MNRFFFMFVKKMKNYYLVSFEVSCLSWFDLLCNISLSMSYDLLTVAVVYGLYDELCVKDH